MQDTLDNVLGAEEPHGTFHDARLRHVAIDYEEATCAVECELCVGDPDATSEQGRERTRAGRLVFSGLLFWSCEPPAQPSTRPSGALWMTSEGPLREAPTEAGRNLARSVPSEASAWYLYFSDQNAFAYVAAVGVRFEWV